MPYLKFTYIVFLDITILSLSKNTVLFIFQNTKPEENKQDGAFK
jgi:hypothetical protein